MSKRKAKHQPLDKATIPAFVLRDVIELLSEVAKEVESLGPLDPNADPESELYRRWLLSAVMTAVFHVAAARGIDASSLLHEMIERSDGAASTLREELRIALRAAPSLPMTGDALKEQQRRNAHALATLEELHEYAKQHDISDADSE